MDQTAAGEHEDVPSFAEIVEGRLLFEPAMMHLVVTRVEDEEIAAMRAILAEILAAHQPGRNSRSASIRCTVRYSPARKTSS